MVWFLLGQDIVVLSFLILPVLPHSTQNKKICLVEIRNISYSHTPNHIYKEVVCYNSWCCKNGCCPWYINFCIVVFIILVFLLFWMLIKNCWHKYCRDMSVTNESQENILMSSTYASRDTLQSYGTVPSHPTFKEEELPTYEEAISQMSGN